MRLMSKVKIVPPVIAIALLFLAAFVSHAQTDSGSDTVLVKKIIFKGNTVIDTETLEKATASYTGRNLTLEELGELTDVVTVTYQEEGYILAKAYLPEQEIKDGVLTISVT